MKEARIEDISSDEFENAVQTVVAGIKAGDPRIDTRLGTVVRSLLVNPEARIDAVVSKQIDFTRRASSLKSMRDDEEAGIEVDPEDLKAVMSNFGISSSPGTKARGLVKVSVAGGSQAYGVPEGAKFETSDGMSFIATSKVVAEIPPEDEEERTGNSILYQGVSGNFFLVPVIASEVGARYNIPKGTSLSTDAQVYTFVSAEAYKSFDGGSDVSNIGETIDKIPSRLSIRGFVSKNACEGMLRDEFDEGDNPIVACSTVGYGNRAQRRDRHNPFGVGIGGRIDLYVRNFGDLYTVTKEVPGEKISDGRYFIQISPEDFPGSCWVKFVSDIKTDVNSPLSFTCRRATEDSDLNGTWHDISLSRNKAEAFNTIWQRLEVVADEVPPLDEEPTPRMFKVTAYCLPEAVELQNYVDREDVRSVSTDVVVRCPIICNVTVDALVVYDPANPIDVEDAKSRIRKYINGLGFVGRLTRSEIVHILKNCGAVSVDLGVQDMLFGVMHDAYGVEHRLSGDALSFDGIADDGAMLTKDTAIFAAEPENIQIRLTPMK